MTPTQPPQGVMAPAEALAATAGGSLSHEEVATRVRMLYRSDFDHEAVCTAARDRIMWLAGEVSRLTDAVQGEVARRDALAAEYRALLARCEGLEAALRNARDYVEGELSQQRVTFKGYEHCSEISSIEADLAQIDAALAATRTAGG